MYATLHEIIKEPLPAKADYYNKTPKETIMNQTFTHDPDNSLRIMIHEMRNPLTNIALANACIEDIANGNNSGETGITTFTGLISKNVTKVDRLLKALLGFQEEETKEFTNADVCKCIEDALLKAEDRMYLQHIEIRKHYQVTPVITGDDEKLTVAFLNIIINAIEAMEGKSDGHLDITVYNSCGQIKVVFKDNGKGMEQCVADQIFQPYFTSKELGLGIGLSHTKKILDMHNACVSVNSLAGVGTSVIIGFS